MTDNGTTKDTSMFKKSVLASVVASIVVIIFIQPILSWFWEFLSSAGNEYLVHLVDRMYANAALGDRNWVIAFIAILMLYVPYVYIIARMLFRVIIVRSVNNAIENNKKPSIARLLIYLLVSLIIGMTGATVLSSYIYTDLQLNTSFNQRLAVLAPHISSMQEEELKASWAVMNSKRDYLVIKNNMDELASKYGVELPKPLLSD